jgi:hypothetical protein
MIPTLNRVRCISKVGTRFLQIEKEETSYSQEDVTRLRLTDKD